MSGIGLDAIRKEGEEYASHVIPLQSVLRDTILYNESCGNSAVTILNTELDEERQRLFAGIESCTLIAINNGSTATVITYSFQPTIDGKNIGSAIAGSMTSIAANETTYTDLVSSEIKFADGYSLTYTPSADTDLTLYLVKTGQS